MDRDRVITEARTRGALRGSVDKAHGFYNPAPLSGEWAGESIPEILSGLITDDMDADDINELCDAYEEGYQSANNAPWEVEEIA